MTALVSLKMTPPRLKAQIFRFLRGLLVIFCCSGTVAGGWAAYLRLTGNIHVVEDGILYRSAQLSRAQFQQLIQAQGIRTIINLRGTNPDAPWYADELKASADAQISHIDFRLSAGSEVSVEKIRQLIGLLRDLPRPILVHCEGGADRSGFVSALFELMIAKKPAVVAGEQLSFRYGHFPWLGSRTIAMDKSFQLIARESAPQQADDSR